MLLYRITLVPLAEELRVTDSGLLSPFYADDADFDSSARQNFTAIKAVDEEGSRPGIFR